VTELDLGQVVEQYAPGVLLVIAWELRELRKAAQDVARALSRPLPMTATTQTEAERPRTAALLGG
jgi:DNA primase